jgi:ABC-type multidrug transport system permease subunit
MAAGRAAMNDTLRRTDGRESTRGDAFLALCLARFREFYRESEAVFWGFVFPILLAVGLGIAFRNRPPEVHPVVVVDGPGAEALAASLRTAPLLKVQVLAAAEAAKALRSGRASLVVSAASPIEYRLDPSRPECLLARSQVDDALQRAAGRRDPVPSQTREISEPGARYIDFLIPGIIGMNIMSGGMWGVGFNLVDMRIKKLLKRLLATPMRRADFMGAHLVLRVAFVFVEAGFLLGFANLTFGVPVRSSLLGVFAAATIGSLSFGGIGVLLAARATRVETIVGLMNVVMMPMFVLSGVFFSYERFPEAIHPVVQALPLTALIDALRALMIEGSPLAAEAGRLAVLGGWGLLGFLIGLRRFRWS